MKKRKENSSVACDSQPKPLFALSSIRTDQSAACTAEDHEKLRTRSLWHGSRRARLGFASISLGSLLERLPKLTVRSETFDPWAPDGPEAPKGVVPARPNSHRSNGKTEREIDVRSRIASTAGDQQQARSRERAEDNLNANEDDVHSYVNRTRQATAASAESSGDLKQDPGSRSGKAQHAEIGSPLRPVSLAALRSDLPATAQLPLSRSPENRQEAKQPANFGEWFSQLLPKLPGSPAQLRNRCVLDSRLHQTADRTLRFGISTHSVKGCFAPGASLCKTQNQAKLEIF